MAALFGAPRYSGANARVHALQAYLIPDHQWAELIDAPDLFSLVMQLQDTWYGPALPRLGTAGPSLFQIEHALTDHVVAMSRRPLSLLQGAPRQLLDWFWRRFEVRNLKTVIRGVHHQSAPVQLQGALVGLGPASTLDWPGLTNAGSVPALIDRLDGTWYGRALRPALGQYRRQRSVFPLEVALDLAHATEVLGQIGRLHGADHTDARDFLGEWLDAQNLLWAFRYRIYARLSPEEILNYTLQRNLRVNADVVRVIALGAPVLDLVQELWHGRLAGLATLAGATEQEMLPRLELIFQRHLYAKAQRARLTGGLRLAALLAYEFLLEAELRDLVAVVEGKSFAWPSGQIRPYLIGERGM